MNLVAIDCVPLADGFTLEGKDLTLHLCVQLELRAVDNEQPNCLTVLLDTLPRDLRQALDSDPSKQSPYEVRVWKRAKGESDWTSVKIVRSNVGKNDAAADAVWQLVMTDSVTSSLLFDSLHESLEKRSVPQADGNLMRGKIPFRLSQAMVPYLTDWHKNFADTHVTLWKDSWQTLVQKRVEERARTDVSPPMTLEHRIEWIQSHRQAKNKFWGNRSSLYGPLIDGDHAKYMNRIYLGNPDYANGNPDDKLRNIFLLHNTATYYEAPPPKGDYGHLRSDDEMQNRASGRFLGLTSHPRLATLVGLSLNFDIACKDLFNDEEVGELYAEIVKKDAPAQEPVESDWRPSTYRFVLGNGGEGSFLPASIDEWNERNDKSFDRGFLNLRQDTRYLLRTIDVTRAMRGEHAQVSQQKNALQEGSTADHVEDRPQTLLAPGFELIDTSAQDELRNLVKVAHKVMSPKPRTIAADSSDDDARFYAENLLTGYRVDIERTNSTNKKSIWASAMARDIQYKYRDGAEDKPLDATPKPGDQTQQHDQTTWKQSRFRHRDEGNNSTLVRTIDQKPTDPNSDPTDQGDVVPFGGDDLVRWTGESLGLPGHNLPPNEGLEASGQTKVDGDLNLTVEYSFYEPVDPNDDLGLVPVLRASDGYRFALRAYFRHGGGPTFNSKQAESLGSLHNKYCLGEGGLYDKFKSRAASEYGCSPQNENECPAVFTQSEPVGAPELAFRADDPLVNWPIGDLENQQRIDRVVLRAEGPTVAYRVLVPPRITFEVAELQKQFDQSDAKVPPGALGNIQLDKLGQLPVVGHVNDAARKGYQPGESPSAFGPVVKRCPDWANAPPHPYYCDARGRTVAISLSRDGIPCKDLPPGSLLVDFWSTDAKPNDAMPIAIECQLQPSIRGARFATNKDGSPIITEKNIGGVNGVKMKVVTIEVGLGDEIQVDLWCLDIDHKGLFRQSQLLQAASTAIYKAEPDPSNPAARKTKAAADAFDDELLKCLQHIRSELACDVTRFRILTAVRQPLNAPQFHQGPACQAADPQDLLVEPFTMTRLPASTAEKTWETIVDQEGFPPKDADLADGDVGYLAGWVDVRRRSTSLLKIQAVWRNFDDETCLTLKDKKWQYQPVQVVREFTPLAVNLPETLPAPPPGTQPPVLSDDQPLFSLGRDDKDKTLRKVHFTLGTKAMRLGIRLSGVSRFANCYPKYVRTAVRNNGNGKLTPDSQFESANFSLNCINWDLYEDEMRVIWLPATQRPHKPELCTPPVELISRRIEHCKEPSKTVVELSWSLRIRLKKRTWFDSGEGELLGVVFLPEDLVDPENASHAYHKWNYRSYGLSNGEFQRSDVVRRLNINLNDLVGKQFLKEVTSWAVDPTTHAGQLQPVISPSYFNPQIKDPMGIVVQPGWVEKRDRVPLPFEIPSLQSANPDIEVTNVSVLGYMPELDSETGERFVDLDIQPPDIDSPFIRLSLVRFQPHAVSRNDDRADQTLSSQVIVDPVQLPPTRLIEAEWTDNGVRVTITGPAYNRRSPAAPAFPPPGQNQELLDKVRHMTDVPWMRLRVLRQVCVADRQASYVQIADSCSDELMHEIPSIPNGDLGTWSVTLPLKKCEKIQYRLFVEEFEYHPVTTLEGLEEQPMVKTPRGFKCDILL
ncbi:MAG TPA: hypothetical protein VMJ32_00935 [Pirellulales bacterium]|nr:hypothetical protein [Pirellulales bacterium]